MRILLGDETDPRSGKVLAPIHDPLKEGDDDDDDLSDLEGDGFSSVKRSSVVFVGERVSGDQSAGMKPTGWGDQLPEDILFRIFSHAVRDDGCIPFLVR